MDIEREESDVTLAMGDEITVEVTSPYSNKTRKLRTVFQRVRPQDGSLEVYDPKSGHIRNFRPEAVVVKHRKKKYGRKK